MENTILLAVLHGKVESIKVKVESFKTKVETSQRNVEHNACKVEHPYNIGRNAK